VNLFVYGTLLDDALVAHLTGHSFPKRAARLVGYRKHLPTNGYPYIVADDTAEVEGAVLQGLDAAALRAVDVYEDEGRLYKRVEVTVSVAAESWSAFVYVAAQ
jgi:gamma-glutamylcyclotransferase (GGCT)/AIG2-like uncharacterized protein YtfP